jgi:hypothetical protein
MPLIRVAFFEILICVHIIGAAVLFRRFFPRESPWLGFVVPIVALISCLNFFEHFVALPNLGWLLPLTLGGMIWSFARPGYSWDGLRFPSVLFVATFTFMLVLKCACPDIPNYTEGAADLTRILNYSLGEKVPATDSWMPPYDSGGYYSFQHYGASVLKRLFSVDIGTALNLSFALLLALLCQMGAAVAFALTGKKWISVLTVIILAAGSSGSAPVLLSMGYPDYALSTALNSSWDGTDKRNPFAWICAHDESHPDLTLVAPTYTMYCSEFHANLGATFLTMAVVLASIEAYRLGRSNWPWICLLVLPMVIILTSAWYFLIGTVLCIGGLALNLIAGRRPQDWKIVGLVSCVGLTFTWPSFVSLSANPFTQSFLWNNWHDDHTPLWMFLLQWWPVFIPWVILCCTWGKLDLMGRWFHFIVPVIFLAIEFGSLTDRGFTVQKMWGDLYGIGLITLLPLVFVQRGGFFRFLTVIFAVVFLYSLEGWVKLVYYDGLDAKSFGDLTGANGIVQDPQRKRVLQVLSSLHGATVLPGKSYWAYNLAPLEVSLSGNRCFVAYTFQEEQYGHGGEINERSRLNNTFYDGTMTDPIPFLRSNDIAAIVVWPEDKITDQLLRQFKTELATDYYYIDCKMDEDGNAGVFMRQGSSPIASRLPTLNRQ